MLTWAPLWVKNLANILKLARHVWVHEGHLEGGIDRDVLDKFPVWKITGELEQIGIFFTFSGTFGLVKRLEVFLGTRIYGLTLSSVSCRVWNQISILQISSVWLYSKPAQLAWQLAYQGQRCTGLKVKKIITQGWLNLVYPFDGGKDVKRCCNRSNSFVGTDIYDG